MANTVYQPHKSSLGVDANLIAAGCYASAILLLFPYFGFFAFGIPLVVFFLEKSSTFVKFSAIQALIVSFISGLITTILFIVRSIVYTSMIKNITYNIYDYYYNYNDKYDSARTVKFILLLVIYLIIVATIGIQALAALKAFKNNQLKLPIIGNIADKVSEKLNKVNIGGTNTAAPPPSQTWTPPAQGYTPPAQQWTPPAQPYTPPAQPYTPPAAPPAQPMFDTETGLPITPPAAPPAQPKFDTETGLPIDPPRQ